MKKFSRQIRGFNAQLVAAINASTDGAIVELDITTARRISELLKMYYNEAEANGVPYREIK